MTIINVKYYFHTKLFGNRLNNCSIANRFSDTNKKQKLINITQNQIAEHSSKRNLIQGFTTRSSVLEALFNQLVEAF